MARNDMGGWFCWGIDVPFFFVDSIERRGTCADWPIQNIIIHDPQAENPRAI